MLAWICFSIRTIAAGLVTRLCNAVRCFAQPKISDNGLCSFLRCTILQANRIGWRRVFFYQNCDEFGWRRRCLHGIWHHLFIGTLKREWTSAAW
ncbi:hypothetical protein F4860DRAFT_476597 [Xylaria cubensis]|nr:hypothetical protein F4860DRAFT_476597 [Xylaria cubensis]